MTNMLKMKLLASGILSTVVMTGCTSTMKTNEMHKIKVHAVTAEGVEGSLGTVTFIKADQGGLVVKPDLQGLPPGKHGFHIHENPSCEPDIKDGKATAALKAKADTIIF